MKGVNRYWGYFLLPVLAAAWWIGGVAPAILIGLSAVTVAYFLFQAPVWCGAVTREGQLCRKNAYGLFKGCGYRQHKWQKLRMVFVPRAWRELNRGLWATPRDGVTTLSALAGVVSSVAAVIALALHGSG